MTETTTVELSLGAIPAGRSVDLAWRRDDELRVNHRGHVGVSNVSTLDPLQTRLDTSASASSFRVTRMRILLLAADEKSRHLLTDLCSDRRLGRGRDKCSLWDLTFFHFFSRDVPRNVEFGFTAKNRSL